MSKRRVVALCSSLLLLFACAPLAQAADVITATSSVEISNDPGFVGLYKYTVHATWSLDRHPLDRLELFIDLGASQDTCKKVILFSRPAGQSSGIGKSGSPCELDYSGRIRCQPDRTNRFQNRGAMIRYVPLDDGDDDNDDDDEDDDAPALIPTEGQPEPAQTEDHDPRKCETTRNGSGTFFFYTAIAPAEPAVYPRAISILHGHDRGFGDLSGLWPLGPGRNPAGGRVVVNEFIVKPPRGTCEFVELFNRTTSGVNLDGWSLAVIKGDERHEHIFTAADSLPPGGFGSDSTFASNADSIEVRLAAASDDASLDPTAPPAPGARFSDNFDGNSIDFSFWTALTVGLGPSVGDQNGRLEIDFPEGAFSLGTGVEWNAAFGRYPDQGRFPWTLVDTDTFASPVLGPGTLTLSTPAGNASNMYYIQHGSELAIPSGNLQIGFAGRFVSGSSMSARSSMAVQFQREPFVGNTLYIADGEIFLLAGDLTKGASAAVPTSDALHTYLIVLTPFGNIQVYYDGALTLTGHTFYNQNGQPDAAILWGEISEAVSGTSEWQYFEHNAGPGFGAGLQSKCVLTGDFDMQVDFTCLDWPTSNGVHLGLEFENASSEGLSLERVSLGSGEHPEFGSREAYRIHSPGHTKLLGTTALAGTLRVTRSGALLSAYRWNGEGWTLLDQGEVTAEPLLFGIACISQDNYFADQHVRAAFDNFVINYGNLGGCELPPACAYTGGSNEVYFGQCPSGENITSGFRFANVGIPQGSQIVEAHVRFAVDGTYDDPLTLEISGESSDNANTFGTQPGIPPSDPGRPESRPRTSASVPWSIPSSEVWTCCQETRRTPDLKSIVQEIVDRPYWQSGNALAILVANAGPASGRHRRVFAVERYDHEAAGPNDRAFLVARFIPPAPAPSPQRALATHRSPTHVQQECLGDFLFDEGGVIELRDEGGEIIDRVGYGNRGGAPISCPLIVPVGHSRPPGFGPQPVAGDAQGLQPAVEPETLVVATSRTPSGADTGRDSLDFGIGPPTQDAANAAPPPDPGSSARISSAFVFLPDDWIELANPRARTVEVSALLLSDGTAIRPLLSAKVGGLPLVQGDSLAWFPSLSDAIGFDLGQNGRIELYESRSVGLVRVDGFGWYQDPAPPWPELCLVRHPSAPDDGFNWASSGGGVFLNYGPCKLMPPTTDANPMALGEALLAPTPNPASKELQLGFVIGSEAGSGAPVRLALYDLAGRRVKVLSEGTYPPGRYSASWNGTDDSGRAIGAGVYFARLYVSGRPVGKTRSLVWIGP